MTEEENKILELEEEVERLKRQQTYYGIDYEFFNTAILNDAISYFRINISRNLVIIPIIEKINGVSEDVSTKYGKRLPTYDIIMRMFCDTYVVDEDAPRFKEKLSREYLKEKYDSGVIKPEVIVRVNIPGKGICYRKYITLMTYIPENDDYLGMMVVYDITEDILRDKESTKQKRELEKALEKMESINRAKNSFLFTMSHDLRTPLNAVLGYSQMIRRDIDDKEKVLDYINKIELSGNNLTTMVNDCLEVAKLENSKIAIEPAPYRLMGKSITMDAIFGQKLREKNITIESKGQNIRDYLIWTDKFRVNQVLFSIVGNAIDYTPNGGHITILFEQLDDTPDGKVVYAWTITDTGIGMSEEFIGKIFDKFTREDNSDQKGGLGVGMAIVKTLIDAMDGTIEVTSKKGEGTTVHYTIPFERCTEEDIKNAEKETPKKEIDELRGKTALIVEDIEINREILKNILETYGMKSIEAVDGEEGYNMVKNSKPGEIDIVLMDIQMPKMDGNESARHIRAIEDPQLKDIPIVAVSANAYYEDVMKSQAAGINAYVAKPVVPVRLANTISDFLCNKNRY